MAKAKASAARSAAQIEHFIHVIRGQRAMLDSDRAALDSVTTKVLNQAVQRKVDRFPDDFAFQLTVQEIANLKSQIVTSSLGHGGRRKQPWAFTEQGCGHAFQCFAIIEVISEVLRKMMEPLTDDTSKRRIGFQTPGSTDG